MNMLSVAPTAAAAAQGLTREDFKRIQDFLDHNVSANTRAMYRSVWTTFEGWTSARAVLGLPASPAIAASYLSHLAEERRLSVSTVRLHKAAGASIQRPPATRTPPTTRGSGDSCRGSRGPTAGPSGRQSP